jgi:hypothetical protein
MKKYTYKNKNYTRVEDLTHEQITEMLKETYNNYKDDFDSFDDMVNKYAIDDFYKYHYVAQAYLEMEAWINEA